MPQDRLLDAVHSLIHHWQDQHADTVLSVDMSQRGNALQLSYVGKFHKAPKKTRVIAPSDIFNIVRSSLRSHIFVALNTVWHQIRGAGKGSHISPSLSNLAVTLIERSWLQMYQETISQPSFPFLSDMSAIDTFCFHKTMSIQWNWKQLPPASYWDLRLILVAALFLITSQSPGRSEITPRQEALDLDSQASNLAVI